MSTAAIIAGTAAGGIVGGALSAHGASEQAKAAENSSAAAIAEQRRQFDITQGNLAPWLTSGKEALGNLSYLMGLGSPSGTATKAAPAVKQTYSPAYSGLMQMAGKHLMGEDGPYGNAGSHMMPVAPSAASGSAIPPGMNAADFGSLNKDFSAGDFQTDPGYDFRLSEGQKALERSAASKGTVLSGGTLKELSRYNQDFASNEYQNAYNRFQSNRATKFNQLASIAGVGQTTATQLGSLGADNARTIGDLTVGGATAAAAARASGYNAIGSSISNAASLPMNWYLLNKLNTSKGGWA